MRNKPDWLFEKNPVGKVPVLEKDDQTIYESLITCDYLEEVYPNPPLYPSDPWQKAKDKVVIDRFAKVSVLVIHIFFHVKYVLLNWIMVLIYIIIIYAYIMAMNIYDQLSAAVKGMVY